MSNPFPRNDNLGDGKEYSEAFVSDIQHQNKDMRKEERAKSLIDNIVSDRLRPIEAQLEALPGLIRNTVVDVITQLQQQAQPVQQSPPLQQNSIDTEKLSAIAQLLGPIFGNKTEQTQNNQLQDMIMNSFAKMIQAKVDETIMATYRTDVRPPDWVTTRTPSTERPKIEVE